MLAVLVLGCSFGPSAPGTPGVVAPPAEPPEVELVYVQASMLRLREHPRPDAAFSTLGINTRVRVLERREDWIRILAPDGRSGWVHDEFLATRPLTAEVIEQRYAAAATAEERALWAERASALQPGDAGLVSRVITEYRAAGKNDEAAALEATLLQEESNRFAKVFPVHAAEVAALTARFDGARQAADLIAVWQAARDLTSAMAEPLVAAYDPARRAFIEGDPAAMFSERMPWAMVAVYAEGTVPALELAPRPWVEAAARTPEAWDDGFFSLVTTAYDNASARGWTAWQRRSWDYGGCSPFGSGENLHLALLRQTDTLAGVAPIAEVVGAIRAAVLRDIEKPVPDEFSYCDSAGRSTPTDGLLIEARRILAEVSLTPTERAVVERRVAGRFGRP